MNLLPRFRQRWALVWLALMAVSPLASAVETASGRFVAQVLAHNPQLQAVQQAQRAARAAVEPAAALDDPQLSYSLAPESVGVRGLDTGYSVSLSQKLPWPGKRKWRRQAAQQSAAAAHQAVQARRLTLILQTRLWLAQWQYWHAVAQINRQQQATLADAIAHAQASYAATAARPQALLAAQLQLQQRQAGLREVQATLADVQAALNALRGHSADAEILLPEELNWPSAAAAGNTLEQHPEVLQWQAQQAASHAQVQHAELAWHPDVQLSASYQTTMAREENRARIGVALNLPLGQSKRRQQLQREQARSSQLKASARQALLQLQRQQAAAQAALQAAQDIRLRLQKDWLPLAQRNLRLALSDFASGAGDFSAVTDAEQALLQARLERASAQRKALDAQAQLLWVQAADGAAQGEE